jgi:hypothetical protein
VVWGEVPPARPNPGDGGFPERTHAPARAGSVSAPAPARRGREPQSVTEAVTKSLARSLASTIGSSIGRQIIRGVLGSIAGGTRRR